MNSDLDTQRKLLDNKLKGYVHPSSTNVNNFSSYKTFNDQSKSEQVYVSNNTSSPYKKVTYDTFASKVHDSDDD